MKSLERISKTTCVTKLSGLLLDEDAGVRPRKRAIRHVAAGKACGPEEPSDEDDVQEQLSQLQWQGVLRYALVSLILSFSTVCFSVPTLKIQGSTTVNPVVSEAAEVFRQRGWKVFVDTQGGSSGGISALAEKQVTIAMSSKPVAEGDKKKHPGVDFVSHKIGIDGLALVVSKKVYDGGVKSLSKQQMRDIYESKIKTWAEVGGPKTPIVFFNKEPGRGTWEVFASYIYGKADHAPAVTHPEVGSNEEGRTKVAAHTSAITQLSAAWAEGDTTIKPLGVKLEDGSTIFPSNENIFSGKYPLTRPLLLVTAGKPTGAEAEFIGFLKSEEGQKLVVKNGYLPLQIKP